MGSQCPSTNLDLDYYFAKKPSADEANSRVQLNYESLFKNIAAMLNKSAISNNLSEDIEILKISS
jgi:hypothetical protein